MDDLLNDDIELTPEELAKLMLPSTTLILPWQSVQKKIETIVANNYYQASIHSIDLGPASGEEDDEEQHHDENSALNVSIPTGFQILRTIGPSKMPIKSVIALSQGESTKLGCIDSQFAHIWQGNSHLTKVAIGQTRGNNMDNASPLSGLDLWIYVPTWKMIILSTTALEIKLMDTQFKVLSTISVPKPVLWYYISNESLEFVDAQQPYLITGSIGRITYYNFKNVSKHSRNTGMIELDSSFLTISDLDIDDWISGLAVDQKRELLFAVYENHVNVTGSQLPKIQPVIEMLILVKVWNSQNCLLFQFKEHYQPVTGICIATVGNESKSTYLLSCSLDCTIRMWNLEDGFCINRTPLTSLRRVTAKSIPSRIFGFGSDGSILIISPRSGQKLIISFPFVRNTVIVEGVYDMQLNRIYLLADTGSILVYTAFFSPCLMAEEWEYTVFQEKVCCMTGLPSQEHFETIMYNNAPMQYYLLICGTDSGQIVTRDIRDQGFQSFVIQAHGAPCIQVLVDEKGEKLTSCSLDGTVKVWKINYKHSEIGEKYIRNVKLKNGRNIYMELTLLSSLQIANTVPEGIAYDYKQKAIGVATKNRETWVFQERKETPDSFIRLKPHPNEDDHVNTITKLDVLQTLPILVNASIDGIVKVIRSLIAREIQFNDPVSSVIFANPRGDLLVALPIEIVLVQVQDYLPPEYLERLLQFSFEDDELEAPEKFDVSSKHWKKQKRLAKQDENPLLWEQLKNMFGIDFDKKPLDILDQLLPLRKIRETGVKYTNVFEDNQPVEQTPKSRRMTIAKYDTESNLSEQIPKKRFFDDDENEKVVYNVPELSLEKMLQGERPKTYEDDASAQLKIVNPLETEPEVVSLKAPVIPPISSTTTDAPVKEAKTKKKKVDRLEAMELVQRNRLKKLIEEKESKKKKDQEALKKRKNAALDIPRPNAQGLQGPNLNLIQKSKEEEDIPELPKKNARSRSMDELLKSTDSLPPIDEVTINYYGMFDDDDDFEPIPPVPAEEEETEKSGKKKKKKGKGDKGDRTPVEEFVVPLSQDTKEEMKAESNGNILISPSKQDQSIDESQSAPDVSQAEVSAKGFANGIDVEGINFSAEYQNAELYKRKLAEMIMIDGNNDENFRNVIFDKKLGLFKTQRNKVNGNYRSYYPKEGLKNHKMNIQPRSRETGDSQGDDLMEEQDTVQSAWNLENSEPKGPPNLHEQNAASVAWGLFKIALKQAQLKKEGLLSENVVKDLKSIYAGDFSYKMKNPRYKAPIKKEIKEEKKKPATTRTGQIFVGIIDGDKETERLNKAIQAAQSQTNLRDLKALFPNENPRVGFEDEKRSKEEANETAQALIPPKPPTPPRDKRFLFMPQRNRYNDEKTKVMTIDEDLNQEQEALLPQKPTKSQSKGNLFAKPALKKPEPLSKISKDAQNRSLAKDQLYKQDTITGWNEVNNDLQLHPGKIPSKSTKEIMEQTIREDSPPKTAATNEGDLDMMNILASAPWFPDFSDKSNITVETLVKGLMDVLQNETMDEDSKVEAALCMRFVEETFETDFQSLKEFVLNAELDLLEVAPAKLQVQIIENLGASKQPTESIMLSLITSLNSKEEMVVNAAIDALGNFGISTKESLNEAMKKYHMFNQYRIETPKEKFVHPLDLLIQKINSEKEGKYKLSFDKVEMWRRKVDPRIQGLVVLRPDSSLVTLVPKERHRRQAMHNTNQAVNFSTMNVNRKKKKLPFYQKKGYEKII
ncbi:WD repeat-containing protein 87 [Boothiomyces sp. JEL0866]|nr:WD repeat-containing protein 87 [Boothiomyces sp. JEL0866]